jgi:hypothetical protein
MDDKKAAAIARGKRAELLLALCAYRPGFLLDSPCRLVLDYSTVLIGQEMKRCS